MKFILYLLPIVLFFSCENESLDEINIESTSELNLADTFDIYTYGPDTTYSRKIQIQDTIAYLANSDGKIYAVNLIDRTVNKTEDIGLSELRDLHLTTTNIIALQAGNGFKILKTNKDFRLKNQRIIQNNGSDTSFMDGFSFRRFNGVTMGDPEDGIFQIYTTGMAGEFWKKYPTDINAIEGEAGYAASGSTIQMINDSTFYWVSGGSQNRFFKCNFNGNYLERALPIVSGEGAGPFSMHFTNAKNGVIVGGDYVNSDARDSISAYTEDGGNTWHISETAPQGYRSSVVATKDGNLLICSGRNGIDYSTDGGKNWIPFSTQPLFSLTVHHTYLYGTMKSGKFCRIDLSLFK